MTLKQLASDILTQWGKIGITSNEYPQWLEIVERKILANAALYLRRDLERNGISERFFKSIKLSLSKVDKADFCKVDTSCQILRTTNTLPEYVRLKSDTSFKFVGTVDRSKVFKHLELEYFNLIESNEVLKKPICWSIIDNYMYIINALKLGYVLIDFIPASVNIDTLCNNISQCSEGEELFISEDIISIIQTEIVKELRT